MRLLKKIGVAIAFILGVILLVILLAWGALNLIKFPLYSEYYDAKSDVCKNPGLSDGFVCQGICAFEEGQLLFVSGYMKDGSASRVYVTDTDDNSYYVSILRDGKEYDGHLGGIATHGDTVYLASDDALHLIPVEALRNAKNGDTVSVVESIPVNNEASFVFADDNYIYVGEFHDGGKYVTNHPYWSEEGTHHAIVCRYTYDNMHAPERVYSIRDKVQGICFMPDGRIVMSTSYGLASSVYYIYDESDAYDSGETLDGAPVYILDNCRHEFKGPAMAEGLDLLGGKVITLTESASDKYIFGKFFFADQIVALDLKED